MYDPTCEKIESEAPSLTKLNESTKINKIKNTSGCADLDAPSTLAEREPQIAASTIAITKPTKMNSRLMLKMLPINVLINTCWDENSELKNGYIFKMKYAITPTPL